MSNDPSYQPRQMYRNFREFGDQKLIFTKSYRNGNMIRGGYYGPIRGNFENYAPRSGYYANGPRPHVKFNENLAMLPNQQHQVRSSGPPNPASTQLRSSRGEQHRGRPITTHNRPAANQKSASLEDDYWYQEDHAEQLYKFQTSRDINLEGRALRVTVVNNFCQSEAASQSAVDLAEKTANLSVNDDSGANQIGEKKDLRSWHQMRGRARLAVRQGMWLNRLLHRTNRSGGLRRAGGAAPINQEVVPPSIDQTTKTEGGGRGRRRGGGAGGRKPTQLANHNEESATAAINQSAVVDNPRGRSSRSRGGGGTVRRGRGFGGIRRVRSSTNDSKPRPQLPQCDDEVQVDNEEGKPTISGDISPALNVSDQYIDDDLGTGSTAHLTMDLNLIHHDQQENDDGVVMEEEESVVSSSHIATTTTTTTEEHYQSADDNSTTNDEEAANQSSATPPVDAAS